MNVLENLTSEFLAKIIIFSHFRVGDTVFRVAAQGHTLIPETSNFLWCFSNPYRVNKTIPGNIIRCIVLGALVGRIFGLFKKMSILGP